MLRFVLGRACTGKSRFVVDEAAKVSLSGEALIIVPEQFSFETERAVLHSENHRRENIQVLSFTKLYSELARITGMSRLHLMSESEKLLLTSLALKSSAGELKIFEKYVDYPDFAAKIAGIIRDMKFADTDAEKLFAAAEQIGGATGAKIHDIALVMSVFEAMMQDKFIDSSDNMTRLNEMLLRHNYFSGKDVYFDSFTGFTAQQYKIIDRIIEQANNVTFSFCTADHNDKRLGIFYNINTAIAKITERAGVSSPEIIRLEQNYYATERMRHLESTFISGAEALSSDDDGSVRIIECKSPEEEVFAALNIVGNLVNNEGFRYRDFIIVARNADTYKHYVKNYSRKSGIAVFYDKKVPLADTLLYIYLKNLLDIVNSFSVENILSFLKCGLSAYTKDDICELENYIYVWNITGREWASEWKMHPQGFEAKELTDADKSALARLNAIREDLWNKLTHLRAAFKNGPRAASKALFGFLSSEKIPEKLADICNERENKNDGFTASVLRQSWDEIMKILDSLIKVLPDSASSEEYIMAFIVSARAITVSNVPQMLDEVTFGSADRIRPSKPKIAIILGANQGVFPNNNISSDILSLSDKQKLKDLDIDLGEDKIKSATEENYLVYSMTCCPTDKSFVLYSAKSSSGSALEPSAFVSVLKNKLDGLEICEYQPFKEPLFRPVSREMALSLMSNVTGQDFETLRESFEDDPYYKEKAATFDKHGFTDSFLVDPENVDELFKKDIYISASSFDSFHACRLKYFLRYGVRTGEIKAADLNSAQRGTLVHFVLEKLVLKYGKDLAKLSRAEISLEVDAITDEYLALIPGLELMMTPRFKFLIAKITKSVKTIVNHLAEEFAQSDFEPAFCELNIGGREAHIPEMRVPTADGDMVLTGKVDRVDVFDGYVRIVDYKTGSKKFDFTDVIFGQNLQMLLYLLAILKNGKSYVAADNPGGILYLPSGASVDESKMAMNGLILDDENVVSAMEKDNGGRFIPVRKKGSSSYISEDMFGYLFSYIERLISDMGETIKNGDFAPDPIDGLHSDACKYCDFAHVCRKSEEEHKKITRLSNDKILEYLKGGNEDEV